MHNSRKGMALAIILGVVVCLGLWLGSLAWTMTNSRSAVQQVVKGRKAYFMARSALEHLLLKMKTMQRQSVESMTALENADNDEKKMLFSVFKEDIIVPPDDNYTGEKYYYRVNNLSIESVDYENGRLTMNVETEGSFGGQKSSISRLIRISR